MRRLLSLALIGLFGVLCLRLGFAQEDKRRQVVKQPIAFNHKLHAESGLQCASCHTKAESKDQAGIPNAKDCLACHRKFPTASATLQTLVAYEKAKRAIPWARIYKLPSFVFFSHQAHLKAKADCATCHGEAQTRAVLWQEKEISMTACMNCHKERNASTDCNLCHELGR
ncbi:MAG: cytochrome c3 family protein [Blastocatellia bacterium]